MTIRAFRPAAALDARTAPHGKYRAGYQGRTVTVIGPERLYPSGLKYYRLADSAEYVPAAQIEWIKRESRTDAHFGERACLAS